MLYDSLKLGISFNNKTGISKKDKNFKFITTCFMKIYLTTT